MKAYAHQTRISPRKAHLVAGMIQNKPVKDAQALLKFLPKRGAQILSKLLISAVSNAENNFQQKAEELIVTKVHVGKGQTLKRYMPVSRGRAHPVLKRTSNITLEVGVASGTPARKVKSVKKEKVPVAKVPAAKASKPTTEPVKPKKSAPKAKVAKKASDTQ